MDKGNKQEDFYLPKVMEIEYKRSKRLSHKEKNINQTVENISSVINTSLTARSFRLLLRPVH